jgi:hypothetical protein
MEASVAMMATTHLVAHKSMMIVMEVEEATRVEANMVAIAVGKVAPSDKEDVDDFADFDDEQAALLVSFQSAQRNE